MAGFAHGVPPLMSNLGLTTMSGASLELAAAAKSLGGLWDWRLLSDKFGIVTLVDARPTEMSEVRLWSLLDREPDWPAEADNLQIELVSFIPWIETFLSRAFGNIFTNEMGKTVSIFLHQLVPEGRRYGVGFQVATAQRADCLSLEQAAGLLVEHGLPFLRKVASGEALLQDGFLRPHFVDPVNWTIRRAVARIAINRPSSAADLLAALAPTVEGDLVAKYSAMAKVTRTVDAVARVRHGLDRFHQAVEYFRSNPGAQLEIESCRLQQTTAK